MSSKSDRSNTKLDSVSVTIFLKLSFPNTIPPFAKEILSDNVPPLNFKYVSSILFPSLSLIALSASNAWSELLDFRALSTLDKLIFFSSSLILEITIFPLSKEISFTKVSANSYPFRLLIEFVANVEVSALPCKSPFTVTSNSFGICNVKSDAPFIGVDE